MTLAHPISDPLRRRRLDAPTYDDFEAASRNLRAPDVLSDEPQQ
jgi:hypothetical protein